MTRIAFVGCGYVFDIYMRTKWAHPEIEICGVFDIDLTRSTTVANHYAVKIYQSLDLLLADTSIDFVINLTNIQSHFAVTKQALLSGRNVYSEKPFTTDLSQAKELVDLANAKGLILTGAPCNIFTDSIATLWKALKDGAIGRPVLIYAELDDNPAHLMNLEAVQSPTGAPFPVAEELQEGCTVEHIGYHLAWICSMFGPVQSFTGFSKYLVEKKISKPLHPHDTADVSIACLNLAAGVIARVTCSWVAPRNHGFRVIGDQGEIWVDNIFHDQSAVYLERFSRVSLAARKTYTLRNQPLFGSIFGIGGRRLRLVRRWKSHAVESDKGANRSWKQKFVSWLRRREIYAQDKLLGIAEAARAAKAGQPQPMPAEFLLHLNEIALLVQRSGPNGVAAVPSTSFEPISSPSGVLNHATNYSDTYSPRLTERYLTRIVDVLHRR
ncbi:Gfo/Idh/MocA family protein [Methylobacterium longum]|uniref:Gfo/Idh/MocA family oxidoreductase n=1 Tax=Methylobacterium longum TaxID=767694 RepID=A0ABT8AXE5_9HYPH|nr:Gfo/Idh/MocA family oxidoreductase [Methylobacterium longum]MDN3573958.1 Gfo/Idh/MocA family oxidoreductase [Methylobacterium longum]